MVWMACSALARSVTAATPATPAATPAPTATAEAGYGYDTDKAKALLSEAGRSDVVVGERTVDVHIRWLRQKIEENPEKPKILITIIGFGYKFEN